MGRHSNQPPWIVKAVVAIFALPLRLFAAVMTGTIGCFIAILIIPLVLFSAIIAVLDHLSAALSKVRNWFAQQMARGPVFEHSNLPGQPVHEEPNRVRGAVVALIRLALAIPLFWLIPIVPMYGRWLTGRRCISLCGNNSFAVGC